MIYEPIDDFVAFLDREVNSAVTELTKVAEASRKHLQKLVYTNVVDRFDSTIDHLLLGNVTEEPLLSETLDTLKEPIREGSVFRLLSPSTDVAGIIRERCEGVLRNSILRERHSRKLRKAFEILAPSENCDKTRVNISTGTILAHFKPQGSKVPTSVPGYADWLYSRRNATVHGGGGVTMLQNDLTQLKRLYHCDAAKTVKLKIGSITNAIAFYRAAAKLLRTGRS